jgi:uncharacterized protein
MKTERKIKLTENFAKEKMKDYDSGHDWWHIERVRKIAHYINSEEKIADGFMLEIACLLHDTADSKFANGKMEPGYSEISDFLDKSGMSEIKDHIIEIISNVSFSKNNKTGNLKDPVLLVLQDADKLDAIGAIGIARAFNYGGFRNNPIYIPGETKDGNSKSTIAHFYDKLLKLKDMMNTETGRALAIVRHQILLNFLDQFYSEWRFGMELL